MGKGGLRTDGDGKRSFASVKAKLSKFNSRPETSVKGDRKGKGKGKGKKGKKGKGKGKKFGPAAINSKFWERKKDEENRTEIDGTFTGTVAKYIFKQGWGFIKPDDISAFPADAVDAIEKSKEEAKVKAAEKGKEECDDPLVYFRKPDVDPDLFPLHNDEAVVFEVYTDDRGVGAYNIRGVEGAPKKERPERSSEGKASGKGKDGKGKGKDSGKGKDKGKGKDDRGKGGKGGEEHHHVIEMEETDASFPFRQKIVGEGGCNVKHIQENCSAKVQVSNRQPLRVDISSDSSRKLNQAVRMMEDLISVVWEEYSAAQSEAKRGRSKGGGKSNGKDKGGKDKRGDSRDMRGGDSKGSKGKGKRRERDDDGPAHKRRRN